MGQKRPLQPKNVWSIRVRLEMSGAIRELALFNLAIDSKLRACDLVKLKVEDLWSGSSIRDRATIIQKKTKRPMQFEVTEQTRIALTAWLPIVRRNGSSYLFPSNRKTSQDLSTRQYARIVQRWVASIGLDGSAYGTHSMRRTTAAQICKKTGNLRTVQILLGHTKLESTVRYLGVEIDDALRIAEQIELLFLDHRRQPVVSLASSGHCCCRKSLITDVLEVTGMSAVKRSQPEWGGGASAVSLPTMSRHVPSQISRNWLF